MDVLRLIVGQSLTLSLQGQELISNQNLDLFIDIYLALEISAELKVELTNHECTRADLAILALD